MKNRIAHRAKRIAKDPKKARRKSREREGKRKKAGGQGAGGRGQGTKTGRNEAGGSNFSLPPPFWFIPY
jgi:hypothetical protein